jgi:hypothetical protein
MSESHNPVGDIIGFLILLWIISWGCRIAHTGWIIFRHRGFSHFIGGGDPNLAGDSNRKKWKKAAKAFGVRVNKLKQMSKDEIQRLYRKKAMKVHPDQGGNADKFRELHTAYKFATE